MSTPNACTLGELEAAVAWARPQFDGEIEIVYKRNGRHGYNERGQRTFEADGTVPSGVAVAVLVHRAGFASRVVGNFKTMNGDRVPFVRLEMLQPSPIYRAVIHHRLAACG